MDDSRHRPRFVGPPAILVDPLLRRALREDLGRAGDITTDAIVPPETVGSAEVRVRRAGRVAGLDVALRAFLLLDGDLQVRTLVADGDDVNDGTVVATVSGRARPILAAERTCLNLLGRLCGIATATRDLVRAVDGTGAGIVCTRKTTPGLRALEKYAVRCGGGANHRFGLDDAVLIKDNHLALAGGVRQALVLARARVGHLVRIEVEVETLDQLDEALEAGADAVLLDNMDVATLGEAVRRVGGRAVTEASGGIRPETAARIAATGVNLLSVGWLTHSAPALDVGLDLTLGGDTTRRRSRTRQ